MMLRQVANRAPLYRAAAFTAAFPAAVLVAFVALAAVPMPASPQPSPEVESRLVDLYSDGTRLTGEVFRPRGRDGERLPAIVLCHGWGGTLEHLRATYAPAMARAGYVVLAFDYRGWGESDSRLVLVGDEPEPDAGSLATVDVQLIREVVDPFDQLEDIQAALDFIEGEPGVDTDRIGIWGTSFGGGLVVWTAVHDPRVTVVVSQVGAMDGRGSAAGSAGGLQGQHRKEIQRARGEIAPVPQGEDVVPGLQGTPYLSRFADYAPVELVDGLHVPTLLIDAENEELFDRREHSMRVYERIKDRVPTEYHVVPGITHYGIYRERYQEGLALAIAWFDAHLK